MLTILLATSAFAIDHGGETPPLSANMRFDINVSGNGDVNCRISGSPGGSTPDAFDEVPGTLNSVENITTSAFGDTGLLAGSRLFGWLNPSPTPVWYIGGHMDLVCQQVSLVNQVEVSATATGSPGVIAWFDDGHNNYDATTPTTVLDTTSQLLLTVSGPSGWGVPQAFSMGIEIPDTAGLNSNVSMIYTFAPS